MSDDSLRKFAVTMLDNRILKDMSKGIIGHVRDFTSHLPYRGAAHGRALDVL